MNDTTPSERKQLDNKIIEAKRNHWLQLRKTND